MELEPKVIRIVNLQSIETNESLNNFLNDQLQLQGKVEKIYIGRDTKLSLVFAYVIFEFSCDATRAVKELFDFVYKSLKIDVAIISPNVKIKLYTSSGKTSSTEKTVTQKSQTTRRLIGSENSSNVSKEQKQKVLDAFSHSKAKKNKKIATSSSMNTHSKQSPGALEIANTPSKPQKNNKTNDLKDKGAMSKNSSRKSTSGSTPRINSKTNGLGVWLDSRRGRSDSYHDHDNKTKTTEVSRTSCKHPIKSENKNDIKESRLALSTALNKDAHLLQSSKKVLTDSNKAKPQLKMPKEKLCASEKLKGDKLKSSRSLKYAKKKSSPSSVKKKSTNTGAVSLISYSTLNTVINDCVVSESTLKGNLESKKQQEASGILLSF
nr:serine/arginine-rich splicing factor 4-like [Leptinotarsa decemlineata]